MTAVLVTGGMGFIGAWVTRKLFEEGHEPVPYARHTDDKFLKDIIGKIKVVNGDILDLPNLIAVIKKHHIKRIIHMATILPKVSETNPLQGVKVNIEGTINVLEAARLTDIERVVFSSSKAVYEIITGEYAHPTYKPVNEDYPTNPPEVYGCTKLAAELMGKQYNRIYGLDFVAMRFAMTFGPGKGIASHGPLAYISAIIESAMVGKPFKLPQGAEQRDDIMYVKDIANGIVLACFAKNLRHHTFQLGTGKGVTLVELVNILKGIFPKTNIDIGPGINYTGSKYPKFGIFDISRAQNELGYQPQYFLEEAVKDYIEVIRRFNITPVAGNLSLEFQI